MPFYMLHSLKKMVLSIQQNPRNMEQSLFHYGLVNILVEAKWKEQEDTWVDFVSYQRKKLDRRSIKKKEKESSNEIPEI